MVTLNYVLAYACALFVLVVMAINFRGLMSAMDCINRHNDIETILRTTDKVMRVNLALSPFFIMAILVMVRLW